uniref:RNase H type-1 domain-containing protein n=1 Tax=Nicotiana tabacum TaxID=4097 RepID=A0A1S4AIW8_TOBAC|nr:PREDICTED: uncharacterized protein LOC107798190 [Nicotiana tabacum]
MHSKRLREDDIAFMEEDADELLLPHNDALGPTPTPKLDDVSPGAEASEYYQVPRYFQVPEETDATKSTAEELEQGGISRIIASATKEAIMVSESTLGVWTLFTDGASNVKGYGLGIVLITPSGETLRQAIRTVHLTNNEAEYEALIVGLELARGLDSKVIEIKYDSQLVVNQVYGIFESKEERMQQYMVKV